jgi:hypothetical protein
LAKKGEVYIALDCWHLKNKVLFLAIGHDTVVEQIAAGAMLEHKKRIVQFAMVFVLLRDGHPLVGYNRMKDVLEY